MPTAVSATLTYGLLGVDVFFVLSGFIIMYAHFDDARTSTILKRYALKRLTRIYPAYWPIGLILIFLYAAMPGLSAAGAREYSLVSSILLVPANNPPSLSVAWTLVHELMFYGVFLLFFVSRRWLMIGLLAWAMMIIISHFFYDTSGWLRYPLSLLNIDFMFGVGAAWLVRIGAFQNYSRMIAILGSFLSCFVLYLMGPEKSAYFRLLFAAGISLFIVGSVLHEQKITAHWPTFLMVMGNASYSIYLVHNPLLSITQRVAGHMALTWLAAMLWGVMLSVLAGWIYYRILEQPALRWFQTRLMAR